MSKSINIKKKNYLNVINICRKHTKNQLISLNKDIKIKECS